MVTEIYPELWTRPGDPNYGRVRDYLPFRSAGVHVGVNRVGDGNFELADSFAGFDDFLLTDPDTPANSKSSTVKWFSALDPTTPIAEWLPSEIFPGGSKDDPYTKVTGVGINGILGYARLEPVDWDGSDDFECSECDWVYGGTNILANPDLESSTATPTRWELYNDASSGTFTLSDGTDTTSAIAFDATALTIETRLQTDIAAITDILVVGQGTAASPWVMELVDPKFGITLTCDGSGLTGGDCFLTETQEGHLNASGWTEARHVGQNTLPFGNPTIWEVSDDQNHTPGGQYSIKIQTGPGSAGFAGAQQVVSVTPGGTYQASVWIYPTSGTDVFGIVIRTLGQDFIDSSTGGLLGGVTLTANQWNELTIDDLVIPDDISQIIFRVVQSNAGPSGIWYLDDAALLPGFAATTIGAILEDLYDHAVDPALRSDLIVWDDGSGTDTPYLTLDFDDTLDSAGNAWADSELSTRLTVRQSYSQIMASFVNEHEYEYRIIPNDVEAGTYLWQVFNPGGMDDTPDVAIQGGASDVKRQFRRVAPGGTDQLIEGLGRVTARARNTALMTALGRIEASTLSREAPDLTAAGAAAAAAVAQSLEDISSVGYTFTGDLQDEPLSSYVLGDTVTIVDPPDITEADKRFIDLEISVDANKVEWEAQFGALVITNADAAVADAVAGLLQKFEYPDIDPDIPAAIAGGGGGDPTIFIACADASPQSKEMAHLHATGTDDHEVYSQALEAILAEGPQTGGRIVISEGTFNIDPGSMRVSDSIHLHGLGVFRTWIQNQSDGASTDPLVEIETDGELSDIGFNTTSTFAGRVVFNDYGRVTNIWHQGGAAVGLWIDGSQNSIDNLSFDGDYTDAAVVVDEGWVILNNVISLRDGAGGGAFMRITSGVAQVTTITNLVVSHFSGVGDGIVIEGSDSVSISNFAITTPGNAAILIDDNTPFHINLADGVLIGDYGISHQGSSGVVKSRFSNMVIRADLIGINLEEIRESMIDDMLIVEPGEHGIRLVDSSDNALSNIYVIEPGRDADDTYDGVILEGNSDRNDLRQVKVTGVAAGNQPRWAINISAATCDDNSYLDCRSGPSSNYGRNAGATATPYNDAGTGTINTWPGAAAPQGDNLL